MHIFHAITQAEMIPRFFDKTGIRLNYLVAFNYLGRQTRKLTHDYREMIGQLYLESGGYATRNGRAQVTLSRYLAFLKEHGPLFTRVFSLDDKHNDLEHNFHNLRHLEENLREQGIRPIPVIHHPEDHMAEITFLAEQGYDYLAIGTPKKIEAAVFEQTQARFPQVKIHLLGKLNRQILTRHRPYSADSSSWLRAAVYGVIHYWHPDERQEYRIYLGERDKPNHYRHFPHQERLAEFLAATFQYSIATLASSTEARVLVNLYFYKQWEEHLNSLA